MVDVELARRLAVLAATDTGRGSSRLAEPVLHDLGRAVEAVSHHPVKAAGIITGFFVPRAEAPAAETDGPVGAFVLARVLESLGARVDLVTDLFCLPVIEGAMKTVGYSAGCIQVWPDVDTATWTHAISIERVGAGVDGIYRNMLGSDVSSYTAPLDRCFAALDIPRIAIGDGGNEIGMGKLPGDLVGEVVEIGDRIRCAVGCDYLIVGGTSNWAAYALSALLWREFGMGADALDETYSRRVLEAVVAAGGVDGISARRQATVDGLDWDAYWSIPKKIGAAIAL